MAKPKRNIELLANNSEGAIELKERLSKNGLEVTHIYTGSSVPILMENGNYIVGAGKIRINYSCFNKK